MLEDALEAPEYFRQERDYDGDIGEIFFYVAH